MVISCKGQPLWFELTSMEIFSFQSSLIVISSPNFFCDIWPLALSLKECMIGWTTTNEHLYLFYRLTSLICTSVMTPSYKCIKLCFITSSKRVEGGKGFISDMLPYPKLIPIA